jgi:hypothetical protein
MSVLGKEIAIDDRLVIGNANQVVELGCNQNIQRRFPATQTSSQSIQWNNILSLGQFALLDPRFVVEYDVAVQFDLAQFQILPGLLVTYPGAGSTGATVVIDPTPNLIKTNPTTGINVPNIVFADFPLSRCTSTIALMINSVETTTNLQNLLALNREWIVDAHQRVELTSTVPNYLNVSPVNPDQLVWTSITANPTTCVVSVVPNQPNTHASASQYKSRASFVPKADSVKNVNGTIYTAVYRFREPVFASPLTTKNAPALANVQSLQLKYNLDNSQNLQGMLSASNQFVQNAGGINKLALTNLKCSLDSTSTTGVSNAQLYIDVLSVDEALTGKIPEVCYYDYHYLEYNNTSLTLTDNSVQTLKEASMSTNGYKLTTMPKYWFCRIMPQINGTVATNSLAGLIINQITIQLGSLGIYTLYQQQLYQCFKNNSGYLDVSYGQWVNMGCPILLNISVDVSSSQGIFQGITGTGGLMWSVDINYSTNNYVQTGVGNYSNITGANNAGQFYAYECFAQAGSCAIGQGSCSFRSTTMSENEFLVATEKGMMSNKAVQTMAGEKAGSLFGSLRGILNSAHHIAKTGAQALQHPMVQKGLQALAGSGMSAGALTHSTRRGRK